MKVDLYNQSGETIGQVDLPDSVFGLNVDANLIYRALAAQQANSRQVLARVKDRSEVRGGGTKPWRQKGTGRARHGSIRSPIWIGGGVTFGPTKDRNFSVKINKKEKRKALLMTLSSKLSDNQLMVVDDIKINQAKTGVAKDIMDNLFSKVPSYKKSKNKRDAVLFVMPKANKELIRSFRNLPFVETVGALNLNVNDLLKFKYLLMLKDAILVVEKHYKVSGH